LSFLLRGDVYKRTLKQLWSAFGKAHHGSGCQDPYRHAIPTSQTNFLSMAISSPSKPLDHSFTVCPVEIEIPRTVREHLLSGIKAKNPRTWLIAVDDAALSVCQYDPGYVPLEQNAITLSPPMHFFHTIVGVPQIIMCNALAC
jgi:hypothetical protein